MAHHDSNKHLLVPFADVYATTSLSGPKFVRGTPTPVEFTPQQLRVLANHRIGRRDDLRLQLTNANQEVDQLFDAFRRRYEAAKSRRTVLADEAEAARVTCSAAMTVCEEARAGIEEWWATATRTYGYAAVNRLRAAREVALRPKEKPTLKARYVKGGKRDLKLKIIHNVVEGGIKKRE